MVDFRQSHRFAGLTQGDVDSFLFGENGEKGVQRGEAAVIDGGAGPVHDDALDSFHICRVLFL